MKAVLFLVLLCVTLPCVAETLYVDGSADGSSTSCSSGSPCNSIAAALIAFGDSTDDLTLSIIAGTYTGVSNVGIIFPSVEIDMEGDDGVIFDCQSNNTTDTTAFTVSDEFTLSDITIANCNAGITFTSEGDDLEIDSSDFNNVNTVINFNGEDLSLSSVNINGTLNGIQVTNATSINYSVGAITAATNSAITYSSDVATDKITLTSVDFTNTAGVSFTVSSTSEDFSGTINTCDFDGIPSGHAIAITNGKWVLQKFSVNACVGAISYTGNGNYTELDADDIDITGCENGIIFSAPEGKIVVNDGSFNVSNQAITVTDAAIIDIDGTSDGITITMANTPISIDVADSFMGEIKSVTFETTGPITINTGAATNATIEDCTFNTPTGRVLDITGGIWGITNVDAMGSTTAGNGGAFYFSGVEATFAVSECDIEQSFAGGNGGAVYITGSAVAFDSCTFTNCNANSGAGVYASNFAALSVAESIFTGNIATGPGGGMDLESNAVNVTDVYVSDTTFSNNTATTGAAVSCCSAVACNITVVEDKDAGGFILSGNTNVDMGPDVTCTNTTGEFYTAASEPDVDISSSSNWVTWLVVIAVILVVVALVVAAGVGAYFYRKRMSYTTVE